MNSVAPLITISLREYLPNQRGFSPRKINSKVKK